MTNRPSSQRAQDGGRRALITGYGGFAGGHLADALLEDSDWRVFGTVFAGSIAPDFPSWPGSRRSQVDAASVDLRDPDATHDLIDRVAPDVVFHLAGQAFVPAAWADPWSTFETNVRMQINVLEAVARQAGRGRSIRVVAVISNEVYGAVPPAELPIDETRPLAPINPYATSKAAQDLVAAQYARSHGLDVVRVRPFNHIGPGQDDRFVVPAFARQIAEIEAGLRPPELSVGNLDAERDFTDVRDIVRGYRLAAERGLAGEAYNLGSGRPRRIGALVDQLLQLSTVAIAVRLDPARLRPADIPRTACDARKAEHVLGWAPRIALEQSLADVLSSWRAWVAARAAAPAPASTAS